MLRDSGRLAHRKDSEYTPLTGSNTANPHPSTITALYHIGYIFK